MALARTTSVTLAGLEGCLVDVEADLATGLPGFVMVGLPDAALSESRDRIRAAIVNSGLDWPSRRMTVALLPASVRKYGSHFDLALALAVLGAAEAVPVTALAGVAVLGELGLDGRVRSVRGVLPAVLAAARAGLRRVLVPQPNAAEAALVSELDVRGVASLADAVAWLRGEPADVLVGCPPTATDEPAGPDLADVAGQAVGRRAVEVAAAGGHNLFLLGPPGSGKTMLAERLPGLLPPLDDAAALEVTAIHSVAGVLPAGAPLIRCPPFESPHHTASMAALVGGGSGLARPGAVSMAHRGVLFLDEAPEFSARSLDALRQPLERGEVVLSRSHGVARYPSRCQLVLAANPCPCASAAGDQACVCAGSARRRYLTRLSGPLLDRIDLHVELLPVTGADLLAEPGCAETSAVVAARVRAARAAAAERWSGTPWRLNADVPGSALRTRWRLPARTRRTADMAVDCGQLSARGYDRVLRVAWTVADLAGRLVPDAGDVNTAVGLRTRVEVAA
ncbi:MAG TPA: YifB family Mg chelatase-like AAA ATPase [Mycobacteriales bacterium]|nr:YifB family Mg chelatase-like AAA ATPase [Mycobacteriales bacterium]